MDRLPPLRLLTAFEEVARTGTMRDAARHLNVTQPAITQAMRALEEHVGVALLDRSRKPARLTDAGQALARATRDGLGQIETAIDDIRAEAGLAERHVTVACTLGMATYWLMPRLPGFYARHPGITVNVQAPPSDAPALSPGTDIALVYGRPDPGNPRETLLFRERVCPVGAPPLVAEALSDGRDFAAMPLIHVRSARHLRWAGWADYLSARGLPRPRGAGTSFDNYVQAVQETLNGRGLMLGWRSITGDMVADGVLAEWPEGGVDFGTAYSLVEAPAPGESAGAFADWLREAAASAPSPSRPAGRPG